MNDFLVQVSKFSDLGGALTLSSLSLSLILAFVLSLVIAKVYQITYRGVSFSPAFMQTLVLCAMVISAVMLIIGSNIARAFSLVGALSIVRFRNAVKDPRDVAYIFFSMAIGMACGTGFYLLGICLTVITSAAALFMSFVRFGEQSLMERVLKIQAPASTNFEHIFDETLSRHAAEFSLISAETTRAGSELELTFALKVKRAFSIEKLLADLTRLNQNLKVQVLGTSHVLDL